MNSQPSRSLALVLEPDSINNPVIPDCYFHLCLWHVASFFIISVVFIVSFYNTVPRLESYRVSPWFTHARQTHAHVNENLTKFEVTIPVPFHPGWSWDKHGVSLAHHFEKWLELRLRLGLLSFLCSCCKCEADDAVQLCCLWPFSSVDFSCDFSRKSLWTAKELNLS